MRIEQAIYGGQDAGGYRFLARSPGFLDAWLAEAERLCAGFGERPAGVVCPLAVFARPFAGSSIAVVQAADQGRDDAGRPGALAFRLLVLPRTLYSELGGDLFLISDGFPPDWSARGELSTLHWSLGPPPPRTVEGVRKILDVVPERTQTLLGAVQALVDGGRVVFVRSAPDPGIVRDLWGLLPTATRAELWPATFAFGNRHGFHVAVVPDASGPEFEHYVREEDAGDYPETRYESALLRAAQDSNQAELDALFARRSRGQTLRLAVLLLVVLVVGALFLRPSRRPPEKLPEAARKSRDPDAPLRLPPAEDFATLGAAERRDLATRLGQLANRLGGPPPESTSEEALRRAVVELDRRIDAKLGEKKPQRDPGNLDEAGPVQRRLRALLWKHGHPDHDRHGLNPLELVERLEETLVREGVIQEEDRD